MKKTMAGAYSSVEEALLHERGGRQGDDVWLYASLRSFALASREPEESIRWMLYDRIFSSLLETSRRITRDFYAGLRVPLSAIFAFGIVLPVIVTSILPLWSLTSPGMMMGESLSFSSDEEISLTGIFTPWSLSILVILAFPLISVVGAGHILYRRDVRLGQVTASNTGPTLAALASISVATVVMMSLLEASYSTWILVFSIIVILCLLGIVSSRRGDVESDFARPIFLDQLASRVELGEPPARSIICALSDRALSARVAWSTLLGGRCERAFQDIVTHDLGLLICETAERDPRLASEVARHLARHCEELNRAEAEVAIELRPICQSTLMTTIVLSPFVLGLVTGFQAFSSMPGQPMIWGGCLEMLSVGFVAEMVIAGNWLCSGLGATPDTGRVTRVLGMAGGALPGVLLSLLILFISGFAAKELLW